MKLLAERQTVIYPNIIRNGSPHISHNRRVFQDSDGKRYTDTGVVLAYVEPRPTTDGTEYICLAREASLI